MGPGAISVSRAWVTTVLAGAHLDMMCGSVYTTSLLGEGVRERSLLSLDQAVSLLSREPAQQYGRRAGRDAAP
jgi:N-acyl-D-aspartate/D-glutamate deacylase